jgi:hypothetical protein
VVPFIEHDKILINFKAVDPDKKDILKVTVTAKGAGDKKLLDYISGKNLINDKQI